MPFKFFTLGTKKVQAVFEAKETEIEGENNNFDFKVLNDGKTAQKIMFVDADGNQIKLT